MLFTDREPVSLADLDAIEPSLARVVAEESLPVSGEFSVLRNATGECIERIQAAMVAYDSYPGDGHVSGNHLAAVMNVYATRNFPRMHIGQVCLNPRTYGTWSPLKQWLGYSVAGRLYRVAWNRKQSEKGRDKYLEKADALELAARRAWGTLTTTGLPVVWNPLPAPAAVLEENSGTWGASNLAETAGGGAENGGDFRVQITWVCDKYRSQSDKQNGESHPTEEAQIAVTAGHVLTVSIATLTPASGFDFQRKGYANGIIFPRTATGWNVYVNGVLQNAAPVPVATTTCTLAGDPATSGYKVASGQYPDVYAAMPTGVPVFRA